MNSIAFEMVQEMMLYDHLRSLACATSVCGLLLGIGPAAAATMTFDTLETLAPVTTFTEDGITVTAGYAENAVLNPDASLLSGNIYLDGSYSPSRLTFRMATRFNVTSFDLLSKVRNASTCFFDGQSFDFPTCTKSFFTDVLVQGFRDSTKVAEVLIDSMATPGTFTNLDDFTDLTRLVVTLGVPEDVMEPFFFDTNLPPGHYALCFNVPCVAVALDTVTFSDVAPVPLPASAPLAGLALLSLALLRQRRRRA